MKCWPVLFFLIFPGLSFTQNNTLEFQPLYNSPSIQISCEKALYETNNSEHFFIHYQIKNLGKYEIEFHLKEYHRLFYPNQWGIVDTTQRLIVNERRIISHSMIDSTFRWMERLYSSKKLTKLKPGATLDYYRDFNYGSKQDIQIKSGEYMYISMDGELFHLTDPHIYDAEFEYFIGCAHFTDEKFTMESTLYLPFPITFKKIPANSLVFHEN